MHTHTFTTSDKSVTKLNSSTSKVEKKKILDRIFHFTSIVAPFFLVHSRDVQHFLKVCYLLGILRKVIEFYRRENQKVLVSNALKVIYKSTSAILLQSHS